ncbi:DUF397 domain-containing protein [Actinomadura citrea]|uniref:DUF397 domain-containing protein n=1 Tax=Actinomadura citrea TaxID=46158 RepID=UPI002E2A5FC0|nr:DUF397 domain-containing protein [Actinomadura citrea]
MNVAGKHCWRRSSLCSNEGNCVELTQLRLGAVGVRDTKNGTNGPILVFSANEFTAFATQVKQGLLNLC